MSSVYRMLLLALKNVRMVKVHSSSDFDHPIEKFPSAKFLFSLTGVEFAHTLTLFGKPWGFREVKVSNFGKSNPTIVGAPQQPLQLSQITLSYLIWILQPAVRQQTRKKCGSFFGSFFSFFKSVFGNNDLVLFTGLEQDSYSLLTPPPPPMSHERLIYKITLTSTK